MALEQILRTDSLPTVVDKTNAAISYLASLSGSSLEVIQISTPAEGDILRYDSGDSFFKNVTIVGTTNQVSVSNLDVGITLSLPQNIHTAATPTFAGMTLTGTLMMNAASEIRLGDSDSSNYTALKSAATMAADVTYVFPSTIGSGTQILRIASVLGSTATLEWASVSLSAAGSNTQVLFNDGGAVSAEAGLTYNKTTDVLTIAGGVVIDTNTFFVDGTTNKVGIKTITPEAELDVSGTIAGVSYLIGSGSTYTGRIVDNGSSWISLDTYNGTNFTARSIRLRGDTVSIWTGATPTEVLTVTATGRVGIGTPTPSVAFDVVGDINISAGSIISINSVTILNSTTLGSSVVNSSLTSVGTLASLTVTGNLAVNTNNLFVNTANNRVGIGTNSPSVTCDIVGSAAVSTNFTVDTNVLYVDASNNRVGVNTSSAGFDFEVNGRSKSKTYLETRVVPTISANAITIDLSAGNFFDIALNANITTMTFSNIPATGNLIGFIIQFTADGTSRSVTWPVSVKWPNNTAPTLTSANGKQDTFTLFTRDGGTTYNAFIAGQNL